jgi:hypothetical protein
LANPTRPVIALVGDGSTQYTVQALFTAAAQGVPVVVLVLNNHEYAILKDWGQRLGVTDVPGLDLPAIDNVKIAEGYGIHAIRVSSGHQLRDALGGALAGTEPVVIDVALAAVPYRWTPHGNVNSHEDEHLSALPGPRSALVDVEPGKSTTGSPAATSPATSRSPSPTKPDRPHPPWGVVAECGDGGS